MFKNIRGYLLKNFIPLSICFVFFIAYTILSVVRHLHFGSYGFDLGISDQIVWKYSLLKSPITTVQSYAFTSILTDHIELIYILLAPFYWIKSSAITLLILQSFFLVFAGFPLYLLAVRKGVNKWLSVSILVSYLMFFGIQNAIWSDVHSLAFGAAFLAWFVYFLDMRNIRFAILFFVLTIISKEDMALLTGAVSFVYWIKERDSRILWFIFASIIYLFLIFFIYFPYFTQDGYRYQGNEGLFENKKISYMWDNPEKRNTILYSLGSWGFLPIFSGYFLIPAFADLSHYYVIAHTLTAAQGTFMHYRVTLASLLAIASIIAIARFKILNNKVIAVYLLLSTLFFQYYLHLPLSYLSKGWFWKEPESVKNINHLIGELPQDASVVSQNNITPHISQRENIFTLYPTKKVFNANSPCGVESCSWFRWQGNPEFLIVETSTDWDARGFLVNREEFIAGLQHMEKEKFIAPYKKQGEAAIYKVLKNP